MHPSKMSAPKAWTDLPFVLSILFLAACAQTADAQESAPVLPRRPFFERLGRLEEQFRRFQEMTLTRLQGIAENYNISYNVDARFQLLAEQNQNLTDTLAAFQATAGNDLSALKFWTKKLQKKADRLELKLSALEESSRRGAPTPPPGEGPKAEIQEQKARISNLTQELQDHRAQLSTLSADGNEVRGGLKGLRDALEKQEARMVQLEEQVKGALQGDAFTTGGPMGGSGGPNNGLESNLTPQDSGPRALVAGRGQGYMNPKVRAKLQLKHDKGRRAKEGLPVNQGPAPTQPPRHTWPRPYTQEQPMGMLDSPQPHPQEEPMDLWDSPLPRPQEEPLRLRDWPRPRPHPQEEPMGLRDRPQPRPHEEPKELWETNNQQEELSDVVDLPQLPLRHKIPHHQRSPKAKGAICNVKSALSFPSASTLNYVTFRKGLARGLLELSLCTWLRVGAGVGYVGTLLSYATEDNDNKLVLYGRNSSRGPTLDFVIGDPAYRELPVEGVLDGHWHHLCVVWSSIEGRFWHYTDRRLTSTGSRFQKGYEVPAGGAVVLGQEQDVVGGGFDEAEAFVGELAGFTMWDRALSPGEVSGVATGRGLPRGTVLTLDDIEQPNGDVQLVSCECLENCF